MSQQQAETNRRPTFRDPYQQQQYAILRPSQAGPDGRKRQAAHKIPIGLADGLVPDAVKQSSAGVELKFLLNSSKNLRMKSANGNQVTDRRGERVVEKIAKFAEKSPTSVDYDAASLAKSLNGAQYQALKAKTKQLERAHSAAATSEAYMLHLHRPMVSIVSAAHQTMHHYATTLRFKADGTPDMRTMAAKSLASKQKSNISHVEWVERQAIKAQKQEEWKEREANRARKQKEWEERQANRARKQEEWEERQAIKAQKQEEWKERQAVKARKQKEWEERQARWQSSNSRTSYSKPTLISPSFNRVSAPKSRFATGSQSFCPPREVSLPSRSAAAQAKIDKGDRRYKENWTYNSAGQKLTAKGTVDKRFKC